MKTEKYGKYELIKYKNKYHLLHDGVFSFEGSRSECLIIIIKNLIDIIERN